MSLLNLQCKQDQTVIVKKRASVLWKCCSSNSAKIRTRFGSSLLRRKVYRNGPSVPRRAGTSRWQMSAACLTWHVTAPPQNIVAPSPHLVSPDLPVGARLVETSQHDTSLNDTPLHDLPSTPAESTPSSSLPVPSSCDIVSGVGHASRTPPSPRRHTNMELAAAGVRKASLLEVIYKNMLLAKTICAALMRIGRETTDQKKLITALLSGPEIKHTRLRSTICKKLESRSEQLGGKATCP